MRCNRTYTHLAVVESTRTAVPCCQFTNYEKTDVVGLDEVASLNDALASPQWQVIRNRIETGQADSNCSNCIVMERQKLESSRTYYNGLARSVDPIRLEDLEIALDFTCNMMCRICKPSQSSKWEQANHLVTQLMPFSTEHYGMPNAGVAYARDIKRLTKSSDFSALKRLRIVGGEPLYSRFFVEFLEHVDAQVGLENVELSMNTNGSIVPTGQKAQLLSKCKRLQIQLSIDAVGDLAETIRPGVPWSQIESNIPRWVQFVQGIGDDPVQIHATLSLMNINKIQQLVDLARAEQTELSGHRLFSPSFLRFDQLPTKHLQRWKIRVDTNQHQTFKHYFNKGLVGSDVSELETFIRAMTAMDEHHNRKFSDINKEIWDLVHQIYNGSLAQW